MRLEEGLFFILRVLAEYFLRLSTVERLCERFSITLSQLRRWLDLFQTQKEEWLGVLSSMETSGLSFLKVLLTQTAYSGNVRNRHGCGRNPWPHSRDRSEIPGGISSN